MQNISSAIIERKTSQVNIMRITKTSDSVNNIDSMVFDYLFDHCLRVFSISRKMFLDNSEYNRLKVVRIEARNSFYYILYHYTSFSMTDIAKIFKVSKSVISRGQRFVMTAKAGREEIYGDFIRKHSELENKVDNFKSKKVK